METEQPRSKTKSGFVIGILLGILVLAVVLRIFALDKFPPSLFGDEIDVGYQAYSLLHTARDYTGQFLPTYMHSFSEWRAPLLMYATVPSIALFGLNVWGVRLVPAFFGVLSVFLLYLFTIELTKSRKVSIVAAFLLAISPWHLQYSRESYEVTLLLSLLLAGLYGFLKGLKNPKWLLLAAVALGLMFYTYSIATLFVPLLIVALPIIYWRQLHRISLLYSTTAVVLFCIIILPFAIQTFSGKTSERFSLISILNDPQMVNRINEQRNIVVFPPTSPIRGALKDIPEKLVHNRPMVIAGLFSTNYFTAFSPQFLFLRGDLNLRQSVGGMGELYFFFLPLLLAGCYFLAVKKDQSWKLLTALILISPVASALTNDGGMHATRLFLMNVPLVILAAFGLVWLYRHAAKNSLIALIDICIILLAVANGLVYIHLYYSHSPIDGYPYWQYGYEDGLKYLSAHRNEFDRLLITNDGEPSLGRTLFYFAYDPATFQKQFTGDRPIPNILPGFEGFQVANMYFVKFTYSANSADIRYVLQYHDVYFVSQREIGADSDWRIFPPPTIKVLHVTYDPWGKPLYYVLTKG